MIRVGVFNFPVYESGTFVCVCQQYFQSFIIVRECLCCLPELFVGISFECFIRQDTFRQIPDLNQMPLDFFMSIFRMGLFSFTDRAAR